MSHFIAELYEKWKAEPPPHRHALVTLMIVAIVLRVANLDDAIRVDEKMTLALYVTKPWLVALSDYSLPNNHLFHTALAKVSTALFGVSLRALRLPALIAGILVVPASYVATRSLYGARAALVATAIVATSWELVVNSANARGYSLMTLAFLLLVIIGARLMQEASRGWCAAFAVVAALGLWTIPVMLLPLGAIATWLTLSILNRRDYAKLVPLGLTLGGTAALSMLCYAPALARSGLAAITRNEFVTPSSWSQFVPELAASLRQTLVSWGLTTLPVLAWALAISGMIGLLFHRRISRQPIGLPHAALLWCTVFLLLNHRAPPERVWQWLIPVTAGLAGAGILYVIDSLRREITLPPRVVASMVVGIALVNGTSVLLWSP